MKFKSLIILIISVVFASCNTTSKKYLDKQLSEKQEQIAQLEEQLDYLQNTNSSLLDRMEDLSIINKNDAESIRSSITTLNKQFDYINELSDELERKDSINQVLASNLKSSLIDLDDEDVQIEVRGSAVFVSLSDRMLFHTASAKINRKAFSVLEKVAKIINDNQDVNVLIEGHTDNVPIANKFYSDNWDLSVNRATSVVRILQGTFDVDPVILTAAGRSEYVPKYENETSTGRQQNRRTEIIITPKLDQFFKLLESPDLLI